MSGRVERVGGCTVMAGDCREVLPTLDAESIDSCVCDPPYHLTSIVQRFGAEDAAPAKSNGATGVYARASAGFMGQRWDGGDVAFRPETWAAVYRVLKPGAHLVAFGGTRTAHRMACAIEDAGFEIRDTLAWVYGSGFPKSANVAKQIDAQEQKKWLDVAKALDDLSVSDIIAAWNEHLSRAKYAGLSFARSPTGTGTSTPRSVFAPEPVTLLINPTNSLASAIIAELSSSAPPHISGGNTASARESAARSTSPSLDPVSSAASSSASPDPSLTTPISIAHNVAWASPNESTGATIRAGEALMTWLGSKPSSRQAATDALCAALTDALKRTTLRASKTFLSLDTKSQTDFVSAMTATITESTAASLISSTVATLRSDAIDRAAGAEREVVGPAPYTRGRASHSYSETRRVSYDYPPGPLTAPATPEAAAWEGWGTALKPSFEPIVLARKPLSEPTVAANVLKWGCGALNIGASRVPFTSEDDREAAFPGGRLTSHGSGSLAGPGAAQDAERAIFVAYRDPAGRWPPNLLHSGEPEVLAAFAAFGERGGGGKPRLTTTDEGRADESQYRIKPTAGTVRDHGDGLGSPARFFPALAPTPDELRFHYCAKAGKADRAGSRHPTVKPVALMRWLCRLVCPPGGVILDPFAGSGTTGEAALAEGFRAVLVEREAEYLADIRRRLGRAAGTDAPLFAGEAP